MKRTLWILLLMSATSLLAYPAGVSVSLVKQGSITQNVGQAVVLTAKVRTPGIAVQPYPPVPGSGLYETNRLRFAFKAHRIWPPCAAGSKSLGEVGAAVLPSESNVTYVTHFANYTWTTSAADAGEYTFSVDVTYLPEPYRPGSAPTTIERRPLAMGTASTSLTPENLSCTPNTTENWSLRLKPTDPWEGHVKGTFYPPSPSPVEVNLTLSASVLYGGEFMWYRYEYTCYGCDPQSCRTEGVSVNFQMKIPNAGQYMFPMTVDKVQQLPGVCIWRSRIELPHPTDPVIYYATAPTTTP